MPYTIDRIAEVARHVLDHTGHERADVLGYSLGGAVAQRLAFKEPERVRRLVLVSSSCGAGGIPGSVRALMAVTTPARHYSKAAYDLTVQARRPCTGREGKHGRPRPECQLAP